jgi:hypothetical protein
VISVVEMVDGGLDLGGDDAGGDLDLGGDAGDEAAGDESPGAEGGDQNDDVLLAEPPAKRDDENQHISEANISVIKVHIQKVAEEEHEKSSHR